MVSLVRVAPPSINLQFFAAFSLLVGLYKWVTALYLTVSLIRAANKNNRYGFIMLGGIMVFNCGLVMDRLLPMYEPIRFGWFLEIGGFAIVLSLGAVMGQETLLNYREKLALEGRIAGVEKLVEMQRAYYPVIIESVEEARRARHDLRHHVNVIKGLVSKDKSDELKAYIEKYAAGFSKMPPLSFCENDIVDVILRHFAVLAAEEDVYFEVNVSIPDTLAIDDADICVIISNLLENALEACVYVPGEKFIKVIIKKVNKNLVILVDNSYDGNTKTQNGRFMSRKRRNRIGIGLSSVRLIAEKYGGSAKFIPDTTKKIFSSEVVIQQI